jgi:DNA polymerase-1
MNNLLLFDVNYLAHRALYSTGNLEWNDKPVGVLYGVLQEAMRCFERFGTSHCAWCFDYGVSIRTNMLTSYKSTRKAERKKWDETKKQKWKEMRSQITLLRESMLEEIGFNNVHFKRGIEADDLLCKAATTWTELSKKNQAIIITSDEDLYQCLTDRVLMLNLRTHTLYNAKTFSKEYGITPTQWIDVKALAGCSSDDIPGVAGVGNATAIKYLTGQLKPNSKAYEKISGQSRLWKRNLPLVTLPHPKTPALPIVENTITGKQWSKVMNRFGFKSISNVLIDPPTRG